MRFLVGHSTRKRPAVDEAPRRCACGCGERTAVFRGKAKRFVRGHNATVRLLTASDYEVEDRGYATPCWIWQHALSSHGGGQVTVRGEKMTAYRAMYEQENGRVPVGKILHHLCEQRPCIRPSHLMITTQPEHIVMHGIPGWNRHH